MTRRRFLVVEADTLGGSIVLCAWCGAERQSRGAVCMHGAAPSINNTDTTCQQQQGAAIGFGSR